jgi:hypothetical protein
MAQIIEAPETGIGLLTKSIASGLQGPLQMMAQMKMQNIMQQQQQGQLAKQYEAMGWPKELAYTPHQVQEAYARQRVATQFPRETSLTQNALVKNLESRLNKIYVEDKDKRSKIIEHGFAKFNEYMRQGIKPQAAISKAVKEAEKLKNAKPLSLAQAKKFFASAGGDPAKATQMALDQGYEV